MDGIPLLAPELADTVTGMDPHSFGALEKFETSHFWFVARNKLILGLINKFSPDSREFIEIGCGNAVVLSSLSTTRSWKRLVGSELHPTGLAIARKRLGPTVELLQMDARRIPVENAFDLIGAFDVIEHIAEDEDVLLAIRQALKPGGSVVISVPQHPWLWSQADGLALHQRRYRRGELEEKLRRTGFEIRFSSSYTAALFPVMALSRLKSRFFPGRGTDDVNREETVGRSVNNAFTRLLGIEVALTLRGMRWPFGGSRVVVATLR